MNTSSPIYDEVFDRVRVSIHEFDQYQAGAPWTGSRTRLPRPTHLDRRHRPAVRRERGRPADQETRDRRGLLKPVEQVLGVGVCEVRGRGAGRGRDRLRRL
jgi:hypothetical protein